MVLTSLITTFCNKNHITVSNSPSVPHGAVHWTCAFPHRLTWSLLFDCVALFLINSSSQHSVNRRGPVCSGASKTISCRARAKWCVSSAPIPTKNNIFGKGTVCRQKIPMRDSADSWAKKDFNPSSHFRTLSKLSAGKWGLQNSKKTAQFHELPSHNPTCKSPTWMAAYVIET